ISDRSDRSGVSEIVKVWSEYHRIKNILLRRPIVAGVNIEVKLRSIEITDKTKTKIKNVTNFFDRRIYGIEIDFDGDEIIRLRDCSSRKYTSRHKIRHLVIGKVRIDPTNIIEDLSSNIPWRSCQFPFRHVSELGERVSSRSILKDGLKRTTTNLKNIT